MNREDLMRISRSLALFRPSFLALIMNLTEDDLVFMEQCIQRTLLVRVGIYMWIVEKDGNCTSAHVRAFIGIRKTYQLLRNAYCRMATHRRSLLSEQGVSLIDTMATACIVG